jgi:glutamine amidotransferase
VIAVVGVGLGNVASVRNMFEYLGVETELRESPEGLSEKDSYVLPGVGAFDEGIRRLQQTGWYDHLAYLPMSTHILGICLGMQLLGETSQEGSERGLCRIPANFVKFSGTNLRVPHMGWNLVKPAGNDPLFDPETLEHRFYFTHSYHAVCADPSVEIGRTRYGQDFTSAYRLGNSCGVQFHPEKSHKFGMSLLQRWVKSQC